jgi:hypothetical protein
MPGKFFQMETEIKPRFFQRRQNRANDEERPRMRLKKLGFLVSLWVAPLVLTVAAAGATFGHLGGGLEQAKKSHFFRWFHLEETARQREGALTVISFRPSGKNFHAQVTLKAAVDAQDRMQALELVLARSFVDHPKNGIFARDIAQSFLKAAISDRSHGKVVDLINEIQYPMFHGPLLLSRKPLQHIKLPKNPTLCYQVYLNRQPACTLPLAGQSLELKNRWEAKTSSLIILIRPR